MSEQPQAADRSVTLSLAPDEAELMRTALLLLASTLGHEEADELEEVQALIARLTAALG